MKDIYQEILNGVRDHFVDRKVEFIPIKSYYYRYAIEIDGVRLKVSIPTDNEMMANQYQVDEIIDELKKYIQMELYVKEGMEFEEAFHKAYDIIAE